MGPVRDDGARAPARPPQLSNSSEPFSPRDSMSSLAGEQKAPCRCSWRLNERCIRCLDFAGKQGFETPFPSLLCTLPLEIPLLMVNWPTISASSPHPLGPGETWLFSGHLPHHPVCSGNTPSPTALSLALGRSVLGCVKQ